MVLDVYEIMQDDYPNIIRDITEHGLDVAKLISTHVDHEDHMWATDNKPNYMSIGNMKFTNVYFSSLDALLNWIQEMLKTGKAAIDVTGMTTNVFVSIHTTLAGLSMWNFNKSYHGFSIAKVRWFVTTLAYLYNAAAKVGVLELAWPDLDYIIEMHGLDRIFVGGPPSNSRDFLDRHFISICVSSQVLVKDFKSMDTKRGSMPHFSLEEVINE
jgi:hypothetical protein